MEDKLDQSELENSLNKQTSQSGGVRTYLKDSGKKVLAW